jgi:hypothetical protein
LTVGNQRRRLLDADVPPRARPCLEIAGSDQRGQRALLLEVGQSRDEIALSAVLSGDGIVDNEETH